MARNGFAAKDNYMELQSNQVKRTPQDLMNG